MRSAGGGDRSGLRHRRGRGRHGGRSRGPHRRARARGRVLAGRIAAGGGAVATRARRAGVRRDRGDAVVRRRLSGQGGGGGRGRLRGTGDRGGRGRLRGIGGRGGRGGRGAGAGRRRREGDGGRRGCRRRGGRGRGPRRRGGRSGGGRWRPRAQACGRRGGGRPRGRRRSRARAWPWRSPPRRQPSAWAPRAACRWSPGPELRRSWARGRGRRVVDADATGAAPMAGSVPVAGAAVAAGPAAYWVSAARTFPDVLLVAGAAAPPADGGAGPARPGCVRGRGVRPRLRGGCVRLGGRDGSGCAVGTAAVITAATSEVGIGARGSRRRRCPPWDRCPPQRRRG